MRKSTFFFFWGGEGGGRAGFRAKSRLYPQLLASSMMSCNILSMFFFVCDISQKLSGHIRLQICRAFSYLELKEAPHPSPSTSLRQWTGAVWPSFATIFGPLTVVPRFPRLVVVADVNIIGGATTPSSRNTVKTNKSRPDHSVAVRG